LLNRQRQPEGGGDDDLSRVRLDLRQRRVEDGQPEGTAVNSEVFRARPERTQMFSQAFTCDPGDRRGDSEEKRVTPPPSPTARQLRDDRRGEKDQQRQGRHSASGRKQTTRVACGSGTPPRSSAMWLRASPLSRSLGLCFDEDAGRLMSVI
jgi:hypothetical protein